MTGYGFRPLRMLFGYRRLSVEENYASDLINFCGSKGIPLWDQTFSDGRREVSCYEIHSSALMESGIPTMKEEARRGLPALVLRFRRRLGIPLGAILFCVILLLSGSVVWSVRVDGNRRVSDGEVISLLRECGLSVGTPLKGLDCSVLANRLLIASEELSYAAVNLSGTVCRVVVRETLPMPEEETVIAANLVAERGGVIQWMEDVRGLPMVREGQTVKEGELLVSGLYGDGETPLRMTCADGRVFARTERELEVKIPLSYEKKVYTGREKTEKYLIFFEKEVKFFGNSRNFYTRCDTINTVEYFELSEDTTLPVGIRTVRYLEYETETGTRTEAEAERIARAHLSAMEERELSGGYAVARRIEGRVEGEHYLLRCTGTYVENIARRQIIEVEGLSKQKK